MNLDDAIETFVIEAGELLEQMEGALLRIEQSPDDTDTLNAIFRAAHTIKGSAGIFGFDHIVEFTHVAESVLDRVRNGKLPITPELVVILLSVRDHLGDLIGHVANGEPASEASSAISAELVSKLHQHLELPAPLAAEANTSAGSDGAEQFNASDAADTGNWHISLQFGSNVLKNGLDPLSFIRYLTTFGQIVNIVTLADELPRLSSLDPETNYFGFEIDFCTNADRATIDGAFDFVRDDARISIAPRNSQIADSLQKIDALPPEDLRLGEILVRSDLLTQSELDSLLSEQAPALGESLRPIGQLLLEQKLVEPKAIAAALNKQQQTRENQRTELGLIRVNAEKLDLHINLIGELIIASASANLIAQCTGMPSLLEAAAKLSRLVEEVRDSALTLRMVQIGATFNRFQRVVHDLSADLGKDIRLEIHGADTDLDKTVVEKIGDPLTHLVRNAIDHGIEPTELRLARGKPAYGTVRLNALHDSGSVVIEISDDGGGLNRERILKKALEQGLVKPDQSMSEQEIYQLIFEPGFSTAEQVSKLSGRGVGMDVVRRNISALRGTVDIDSKEGIGTTIRIRLPLTLAIIDGFLVGVRGSSFVVPLDMVVECLELSPEKVEDSHGRDYLNLRGEVLPYIHLKKLFAITDLPPAMAQYKGSDTEDSATQLHRNSSSTILTAEGAAALAKDPELAFLLHPVQRENVIVVQHAGRRAGLVVDQLMGEFQTVIRPLGETFDGLDGISGFTILGDGNVALILDVPGLVRRVTDHEASRNVQAPAYAMAE